ncbi:MAG: 3-methyl-2-oxobutanoate hydroxymethyltransferase [Deltaproteobacteria bacterium]|nr:3-methyl-2-oxobutanoate hydroxymethyltransferase [Deltaproteobacteria bacterium]
MRQKVTIHTIREKKEKGEKLSRTVVYDYTMAVLAEEAGIDIINMGDSIVQIVLGSESTVTAEMDFMIAHARGVRKGAPSVYLMGDMPFLSYQASIEEAIRNAGRFVKEALVDAVKIEGGVEVAETAAAVTRAGIPVIGHTGLTPQTATSLGGYKTQGRDARSAMKLMEDVRALEEAGAVAVVLESVPSEVTRIIYERCTIPLFGTGVGKANDAPSINMYDMLGFFQRTPRFAKRYSHLREEILRALRAYIQDVQIGGYPGPEHEYTMLPGEMDKLQELLGAEHHS